MVNEINIPQVRTEVVVRKIGDSYYILLDKDLRKRLSAEDGSVLGAKLWHAQVKDVKCPKCKFEFPDYVNSDPHDCPACGEEFLDVNAQEKIEEKDIKEVH